MAYFSANEYFLDIGYMNMKCNKRLCQLNHNWKLFSTLKYRLEDYEINKPVYA